MDHNIENAIKFASKEFQVWRTNRNRLVCLEMACLGVLMVTFIVEPLLFFATTIDLVYFKFFIFYFYFIFGFSLCDGVFVKNAVCVYSQNSFVIGYVLSRIVLFELIQIIHTVSHSFFASHFSNSAAHLSIFFSSTSPSPCPLN